MSNLYYKWSNLCNTVSSEIQVLVKAKYHLKLQLPPNIAEVLLPRVYKWFLWYMYQASKVWVRFIVHYMSVRGSVPGEGIEQAAVTGAWISWGSSTLNIWAYKDSQKNLSSCLLPSYVDLRYAKLADGYETTCPPKPAQIPSHADMHSSRAGEGEKLGFYPF
jgi:hypothetical protein